MEPGLRRGPGSAVPLRLLHPPIRKPEEACPRVCGASLRLGRALLCGGVESAPQQRCDSGGRGRGWGGECPSDGARRPPAPPPGAAAAPPPAPGSPRGCAQQRAWEALIKTIARARLIR